MANLNRVFLMGNLTRDPELRYTPSGSAVTNLGLAVNSRFKTRAGETKEETAFITVVAWGKQAETCSQFLAKGRPIFVEGRLQMRSWESSDGQKRNVLQVIASRVQFLGRAQAQEEPVVEGKEEPLENILNENAPNPPAAGLESSSSSQEVPF